MVQLNKETKATVELLLKQQSLVSELNKLQGSEWEYGDPRRGDIYGKLADEAAEVFDALLKAYGIDKATISPYIPKVVVLDDDDEEEEVNKDSVEEEVEVEISTEDLEEVRKRLHDAYEP